jgi:hypothetical protein
MTPSWRGSRATCIPCLASSTRPFRWKLATPPIPAAVVSHPADRERGEVSWLNKRVPMLAVLLGAVGCVAPLPVDPPGPEVPRISQLSITPERVKYGCPVTMRFRFEDPHGDIVRAHAYWRVQRSSRGVGSRSLTLPIDAAMFAGKTSGEVRVQLSPEQYRTTVWYDVQVEDAAGRKSNVLDALILVDAPWPWEKKPPMCG